MRGREERFWVARIWRTVITIGGNCGHGLPFNLQKTSMIRNFALLACPEQTIEASFTCAWVLRIPRLRYGVAYYAAKPPLPAIRAEDKLGAAGSIAPNLLSA